MSKGIRGIKLGTSIKSTDGKYIYHLSIIDYLQNYTLSKKFERLYKIAFSGAKKDELSSVNVMEYRKRFMKFMKEKVFNYDYNHNVDVCKISRQMDTKENDSFSMIDSIANLDYRNRNSEQQNLECEGRGCDGRCGGE